MDLYEALGSAYFWAYTAAATGLLAAAWLVLFWLQRRGRPLLEYHRRFWTWVLLCGVIIPAVLLGHEAFILVVSLVALFACQGFARATGLYRDWIFTGLVYLAILVVNAIALWAGLPGEKSSAVVNRGYDVFMATPLYAVALLCILPVLRNRSEGMLQLVALAVMAFVYFGYFLAHLSLLAGANPPGVYGYLFFLLFGTSTTGLISWLAGRRFGHRPLAPRISTDITWEGTAAGLAWACAWSFGLGWTLPEPFDGMAMLLSAVLFGLVGTLGDLVMCYVLRDPGLRAAEEEVAAIPYLALTHLNRLIFVAPFFFRLIHLVQPEAWAPAC